MEQAGATTSRSTPGQHTGGPVSLPCSCHGHSTALLAGDARGPSDNGAMKVELKAIGFVHSTRAELRDDDWDKEIVSIQLDADVFTPDALLSLDQFSHVE